MGSPDGASRTDDSSPQHTVRISRNFYMGTYEVTQEQFTRVMEMSPSHFCSTGVGAREVNDLDTDDFPVDRVTWEEAVEFCGRLSDFEEEVKAGRVYRLPTEAEWEYACRAGSQTAYACGDSITSADANIAGPASVGRTRKVGAYAPNAFGLHDMHGNVWEWCADGKREYTSSPQTDPQGDPAFYSMLRGGAWDFPAESCRSDFRREAMSGYVYFGFRVVCEVQ